MKKIIIGLMLVVAFLLGGVLTSKVYATYIQDLATGQKIYKNDDVTVNRFEWFSDVCYVATGYGGNTFTPGISCLKK